MPLYECLTFLLGSNKLPNQVPNKSYPPFPCQETNLELGFPANLVHVIRPDSYLYNLSLLEMDTRMMEVRWVPWLA